jgi:foldase protein PrsA
MLALKKLAGDNVAITDEDMQRAFVRDYGPRVKAKMIMLDNPRRATEVWEKAVAAPQDKISAEFGALARQHSIDPTSRPLDGAIPPIRRIGTPETQNLEKAAFALQEGEVSGIIQVGLGRYVILLCEGRTEQTVEFDQVKEDLYQHLTEEKVQESVAKVFEKLKSEARVDNYLTNTSSGGATQASTGAALGGVRQAYAERPSNSSAAASQPADLSRTARLPSR